MFADPGATWDDLIFIRESFCLERHRGRLQLRHDHLYYYQIVALLNIVDLDCYHFSNN